MIQKSFFLCETYTKHHFKNDENLLRLRHWSGAKECASCRSREMLKKVSSINLQRSASIQPRTGRKYKMIVAQRIAARIFHQEFAKYVFYCIVMCFNVKRVQCFLFFIFTSVALRIFSLLFLRVPNVSADLT